MLSFLAAYGYIGLFLASFLAATILPISSEVVLSLVLEAGLDPFWCIIVTSIGNTLGGMTCYWIGLLGKVEWMEKYLKIKYEKVQKVQNWAQGKGAILAAFTFLPIVGDLIALALGFLRSNAWWVLLFMFIGKTIRYLIWIQLHLAVFG
ncbi:MAG TPA: VTT domain-containing protein [Paludibacteraceae bacterium]|nr:VTT domain-containing protein [Paludibacteraceae bacterium]HQF50342.1 VTT domain-containing protein [Paludibacteraceae bacterium]HQJ90429.1 VTT domain-containing protein [Paludibacteraceae bacterium]